MSTSPLEKRKIAIIGSGIGGLACAVQLAHAGCKVTVFEKNEEPGGRMAGIKSQGFTWDSDPWSLNQPEVYRALWNRLGRKLEDYLTLIPLEVSSRYFWTDGTRIDNDPAFRKREDVARYLAYGKGAYELAELFASIHGAWWQHLLHPSHWAKLAHLPKLLPGNSVHRVTRKTFADPHLVQIFDQYAARFGSSPFFTHPALSYLPYLETQSGAWHVQGGIHQVIEALLKVAAELGVELRTDCEVTGVYDSSIAIAGKWDTFDAVICNQDALMAYQSLLPRRRCGEFRNDYLDRYKTSLSSFTLHLGVNRQYPQLSHHNIFFSNDPEREFRQIVTDRVLPEEPTIYVTASSRTEPSLAPEGCDNWTILVDTPPMRSSLKWDDAAESFGNRVIERLENQFGFEDLSQHIVARTHLTPTEIRNRYQCFGGSLQGFAPHDLRNALIGPTLIPPGMSGFFLTGGSMRPGGIPSNIIQHSQDAVHHTLRFVKGLPAQTAPADL